MPNPQPIAASPKAQKSSPSPPKQKKKSTAQRVLEGHKQFFEAHSTLMESIMGKKKPPQKP